MEVYLEISGIKVYISGYPFEGLPEELSPFFVSSNAGETEVSYFVEEYIDPPMMEGTCIFENGDKMIYKKADKYTFQFLFPSNDGKVEYYTVIDFNAMIFKIMLPHNYRKYYFTSRLFMSLLVFDFVALMRDIIVMHASIIRNGDDAILFTGRSGIGKSTQADLWKQYKQAEIINGDRAFIHIAKDCTAYGSPYAGSSGIYTNESARIKAIVYLGQAKENRIRRAVKSELYKILYPRFSVVRFDGELMTRCIDMINALIDKVPIYVLECYPGEEAVELLYQTIYAVKDEKE